MSDLVENIRQTEQSLKNNIALLESAIANTGSAAEDAAAEIRREITNRLQTLSEKYALLRQYAQEHPWIVVAGGLLAGLAIGASVESIPSQKILGGRALPRLMVLVFLLSKVTQKFFEPQKADS